MKTTPIVFSSPGLNKLFCLLQGEESVDIQADIAKGSVKRLYESIVRRFIGP